MWLLYHSQTKVQSGSVFGEQVTATQALQCETAEELMETVKAEGIELTKEEAEAYLAELDDYELDSENLKQVAGGECWGDINQLKDCPKDCTTHNG